MPKPTLEYLQARLILELEKSAAQQDRVEILKRQIEELKFKANPFGLDEQYVPETVLMWRHTYGPSSRRRHTYTFVAIKVAADKWRVRNETISWDNLCDNYLSEADDGEVFITTNYKRL